MTYNAGVPLAADRISQSQPPFLVNFGQLNTLFNVDHVQYTDSTVANRGFHRRITFQDVLTTDPNQVSPISSLYTKTVTNTELFFQNGNLSTNVRQMTNLAFTGPLVNGGSAGGTLFFMDTPWNVRIYWGTTTSHSGGPFGVNFPTAFTTIFFSNGCANTGSSSINVSCLQSNANLQLFTSNNASVNWFAFGRL